MYNVKSANRVHVPDMERVAENQRPKTHNFKEAKLYCYVGTNLYQWYAREDFWMDPFGEPFVIEEL